MEHRPYVRIGAIEALIVSFLALSPIRANADSSSGIRICFRETGGSPQAQCIRKSCSSYSGSSHVSPTVPFCDDTNNNGGAWYQWMLEQQSPSPDRQYRLCFSELEGSSQCEGHRNSCTSWIAYGKSNFTLPFRDVTDGRVGGCIYTWKIEELYVPGLSAQVCQVRFLETEGWNSSQCKLSRDTSSGWSDRPKYTLEFHDNTNDLPGGCTYQWQLQCKGEPVVHSPPATGMRLCFSEREGSSQAKGFRSSCSSYSGASEVRGTDIFNDETDDRLGGAMYQWKVEQRNPIPNRVYRLCFSERGGSSQCQGSRSSCTSWVANDVSSATRPFQDRTDNRTGGCKYTWKMEEKFAVNKKPQICRLRFIEMEGSSQCQLNRDTWSGWSDQPKFTSLFRDNTDSRAGGCSYQWQLQCRRNESALASASVNISPFDSRSSSFILLVIPLVWIPVQVITV